MKFEPTYDYGQSDLNKEGNLVLCKFGGLIKSLITISSDADRQRRIIGMGIATDDMALDFDAYFTSSSSK